MIKDDNESDNVKQLHLNLVPPGSPSRDEELLDCLNKGIDVFNELVKAPGVQSFFVVILDESELPTFVGAGEQLQLKTLGALEMAKNELLAGM